MSFKQYNQSKAAKYRLLYRSLCDSVVPYTYFTLSYAGKPSIVIEESMKYYVTGNDEYTKHLVTGLINHISITRCNVSIDRYFTSILPAQWTSEKGFTVVGTMRQDRKGIPKEIKAMENRDEKGTMYLYETQGDVMLVSYLYKKTTRKKE